MLVAVLFFFFWVHLRQTRKTFVPFRPFRPQGFRGLVMALQVPNRAEPVMRKLLGTPQTRRWMQLDLL